MRRRLALPLLMTLGLSLGACAGGYYVRVAPPPPRYGVIGYAPGPGYVWTDGYWDWRGGNWFWVGGRWMHPSRAGAVWVAPRWVPYGHRYRFVHGYWRR